MIALVTGGAGRLGGAIAARLAADGWSLALHVHRPAEPDAALAAAIAAHGTRWATFEAELGDAAAVDGLVARVVARFGEGPRLLVNSASLFTEGGWDALDYEDVARHLAVNTVAPAVLAARMAAALPEGADGCVVNLLDQRVANPPVDQAAYTASKLALAGLTRVMARALAPRVRVNGVSPGLTIPTADYGDRQMDRLAAAMPLHRLPAPADVAEAVVYLARAEAVTGQIIGVDAGAALESWPRDFVRMER